MSQGWLGRIDRTNALVAAGVLLTAMVVYALTRAATVSFWDCGEFIACSYVLGIPHPPGTPLYILFGRLFTLLPLSEDIAVRTNLLSAICSAFTAMFAYLIIVRMLNVWFEGSDRGYSRFLVMAGGVAGAFFVAWSLTNWNNSMETEVYGMAMMLSLGMLWLTLIYHDQADTPAGQRVMLLVVFLAFLGIGVHMTVFLVFPVLALFFVIKRGSSSWTWYLVAMFFIAELWFIFAFSSLPGEVPYYLPIAIVFIAYLFYIFSFEQIPRLYLWSAGGMLLALAPMVADVVFLIRGLAFGQGARPAVTTIIGWAAALVMLAFGFLCLYRAMNKRTVREARRQYAAVAAFIGVGVFMIITLALPKGYSTFLVMTSLAAAGLVAARWREIHWPILVAVGSVSLIMLGVYEYVYGLAAALVAVLVMGLVFKLPRWREALLILLVSALGFSVHGFIPIRSAQQPVINENNPSASLEATIHFLERKQYGEMSMIERMFIRRADWSNQFGDYPRMGFWGFFNQQYGLRGPSFVLLFLLGLFGIWEMVRRKPRMGLSLLLLLLIGTVGLILYMNFADGTRDAPGVASDRIEVRDRDYFFTPGFIFFGMAIGLGLAIAARFVLDGLASRKQMQSMVRYILPIIFLLPVVTLVRNYHECDQSDNYIAYDYAWNLLQSADENSVLFTNGDNDTFPLWCLQEVHGVRRDVTVINLSLANTKWYIKQIQSIMGLNLGWSEEHIDELRAYRLPDRQTLEARGQQLSSRIYSYLAEPEPVLDSLLRMGPIPYGEVFQYRDMVIDRLIYLHLDSIPIAFSVTTGGGVRRYLGRPLDGRIILSAMDWRVAEEPVAGHVDVEEAFRFFGPEGEFQARGVADPDVYKDETALRLTNNWANGFLVAADSLARAGDYERAEFLAARASRLIPHSDDAVNFLGSLFAEQGKVTSLDSLARRAQSGDRLGIQTHLAVAWRQRGEDKRAEPLLKGVLQENPRYRAAYENLLQIYFESKDYEKMEAHLRQWLQHNPNDRRARTMLGELERGNTP